MTNSVKHFEHKCMLLYNPLSGLSFSTDMHTWCIDHVEHNEYLWNTWPYISSVVSFKNEIDLIAFKIVFGV